MSWILRNGLAALVAFGIITSGHAQQDATSKPETTAAPQVTVIDSKIGDGAQAIPGSRLTVHYTGWLYDANAQSFHGKKFDSSLDRHEPFTLVLGAHQVIRGWEQGLAGMKVGGKRTLIIPSELGYGRRGAGGVIGPNAVLVFDVELMAIN